ncbi:peptide-methionine (S)-S-oxide reductase MsrA [Leptospira bouyouniensis]|uniref:peptide-methionine (S)-S-oxide reductase MsrA n=1 Tax=Leptospira bouyouniensis TaxID=2484911 RepID=UPI00109126F9|nr:peptide-methionine (S)-S-oxide reductase MsrA [Leptospira bouyouniensis]TGM85255.1 peptide-methionine (S)-S-oxide reductase [Leptospira bouyouniensis]
MYGFAFVSTKNLSRSFIIGLLLFQFFVCGPVTLLSKTDSLPLLSKPGQKIAVFAEGCFWCSEHIFESIPGVIDVISGYAGGHTENPTYDSVNTETTGHAESVYIVYDPSKISYAELCRIFFLSHDPTTKDRQGPDIGSSYRSILFYSDELEFKIANQIKDEIQSKKVWNGKIVTEFQTLRHFYQAEGYHQNFIQKNPTQSYVLAVSIPRYNDFKTRYKTYNEVLKGNQGNK